MFIYRVYTFEKRITNHIMDLTATVIANDLMQCL